MTTSFPRLDRAAHLRTQPESLTEARDEAVYLPVWRNKSLVERADPPLPVLLDAREAEPLRSLAEDEVFLGFLDGRAAFALALPGDDEVAEHPALRGDFNDLRMVGLQLDESSIDVLAAARGLLYWHRHARHCGACGGATEAGDAGFVRVCQSCDERIFPRTDPAIMALIEHEGRILLARQPRFPPKMYSILAGFVEPGESLEQALHREVFEEAGLRVHSLRYIRSQSWPFPSSLMLGFHVQSESPDFTLDQEELEAALWVSRDELRSPEGFFYPPSFSLSGQLIRLFLDEKLG
ncbi:MAG: NAD(+) diphosphatase [Polyangiaceae bacterium]